MHTQCPNDRIQSTMPAHFLALCEVARISNWLAKRLTGSEREQAYRIKDHAISSLIVGGWAFVNGKRVNDTIGLEFPTDPPTRLHIPLTHLRPEARARVLKSASSAPVVAPLLEMATIKGL
jgi:hypothetical protein